MKPLLTVLLGLWFVAAPAVCNAVCWAPDEASAMTSAAATTAALPSCHESADEGLPSSAPDSDEGEDCCDSHDTAEMGPLPADAAAPNAPAATLPLFSEAAAESGAQLSTAAYTLSADADSLHSPYRRANPPLLN